MKAIDSYTPEDSKKMYDMYKALHEKVAGTTRKDWFVEYKQKNGYAHFTFQGTISNNLVELLGRMPTNDEIILLVDGYSHFGATCTINGMNFSGRVNTD